LAERMSVGASTMSSATIADFSNRIVRSAGRMQKLAGRLLDACQIGVGTPSIVPVDTDLSVVVQDVARSFADVAERAGSNLSLSTPGPVVGHWDPVRLEEAIGNLVDNAIKFGAPKPI